MQNEIINTTGVVAGQIATSAMKNTTCTINLSGVPAAVTVLGSIALFCGTIITLVCITTPKDHTNEQVTASYEV